MFGLHSRVQTVLEIALKYFIFNISAFMYRLDNIDGPSGIYTRKLLACGQKLKILKIESWGIKKQKFVVEIAEFFFSIHL